METPDRTRQTELLNFYAFRAEDAPVSDEPAHSRAFLELPTLELRTRGRDVPPLDEHNVEATLEHVRERRDCADFGLNGLLRMLYRYEDGPLPPRLSAEISTVATEFVYWFDEPGTHEMWFCTENHQLLFHTAELLAGQRFPEATFTNDGRLGREHREHAEKYVERWLDWHFRLGFSEWTSNHYFDDDAAALANLADFAENPAIRERSRALLDLLLFEIALNSFHGTFGSTHGRTYAEDVLTPRRENTSAINYLLSGEGSFEETLSRGAISLATGEYVIPAVVSSVARDDGPMVNRERHGIDVETAADYGLDPTNPNDQLYFWGALSMGHRDVAETALELCPTSYPLRYGEIAPAVEYHRERTGTPNYEPDPNNTALSRADVYTYRTSDYMLSCAQDYRKGKYGFQHHVWQATLPDGIPVFTSHPKVQTPETDANGYWVGNGILPRAAGHRSVLVCCYRFDPDGRPFEIPGIPGFEAAQGQVPFTHAFFPRGAFEEWTERDGWTFGVSDGAYVALRSTRPATWSAPDEPTTELLRPSGVDGEWIPEPYELVADGDESAWVCQLGSEESYESFESFVSAVAGARFEGDGTALEYESPDLGRVAFDWDGAFRVDGETVPLHDHPRFDNPHCTAEFGSTSYEISCDDETLRFDF